MRTASETLTRPEMPLSNDVTSLKQRTVAAWHRPSAAFWISMVPFAVLVWFVLRFGVNVPYQDQWGQLYLFQKIGIHSATFKDFWRLNNEHRVLFPNLIWMVLAFATKWNLWYDMFFDLLLTLVAFVGIYKLASSQRTREETWLFPLAMFLSSALLFSLIQYENWLWGYQLGFMLVHTCLTMAVLCAAATTAPPTLRLCLSALFCVVASFSSAQGLFCWLAVLPTVTANVEGRRRKCYLACLWVGLFLACAGIYSIGFYLPQVQGGLSFPDRWYAIKHPWEALRYLLSLIGAPFAHGFSTSPNPIALGVGSLLVVTFAVLALYCLIAGSWRIATPWVSLGLFALAFATTNTIGRSGWGLPVAVNTSRYTSSVLFLAIAVVQMGRIACRAKPRYRLPYLLPSTACLLLVFVNAGYAVTRAKDIKRQRTLGKTVLPLLAYVDPKTDASSSSCLFSMFPVVQLTGWIRWIRGMAPIAEELGFREFVHDAAFVESPLEVYGIVDTTVPDGYPVFLRKDDMVEASGWAINPGTNKLPRLVVFSYSDRKTFIAAALVGSKRPDVAAYLHDQRYLRSGWRVSFPASFLPEGKSVLKAWVYDSDHRQFVRLSDLNNAEHVMMLNP